LEQIAGSQLDEVYIGTAEERAANEEREEVEA